MTNDKLIDWLCLGIIVMGFIMALTSLWAMNEFKYYESMEEEYLKVIKEYHQSKVDLLKIT